MNIKKFINESLNNEGCTLSLNTGIFNPNNGFMAAYKECEHIISIEDFKSDKANKIVLDYIIKNENKLRISGNFVGAWLHNGLVYLDVSKQFSSESDCITFAKLNKQLSYFNLDSKQVHFLTKN